MTATTTPEQKRSVRAELLARRAALSPERLAAASRAVCERLRELPELALSTIALYRPLPPELDLLPLARILEARGASVCYPRVVRGRRVLAFGTIELHGLRDGPLGLREPAPEADLALESIDGFLVPGLGFDRTMHRLGYGAGHYDATLAAHPRALRIGVCLEELLVDALPCAPHDEPLDRIVTPKRLLLPPPGLARER